MPEARQIAQKLRNSETQKLRTEIRRILGLCFGESKKPVQHRGAGELSRLAKQPRSGCGLDWSEATQRSVVGVQVLAVGVACTPATWRTRVWAAPTVLTSPLGGARSRYTDAACGAKARQLANSPHRLFNYFQMLVQGLSMPLS